MGWVAVQVEVGVGVMVGVGAEVCLLELRLGFWGATKIGGEVGVDGVLELFGWGQNWGWVNLGWVGVLGLGLRLWLR